MKISGERGRIALVICLSAFIFGCSSGQQTVSSRSDNPVLENEAKSASTQSDSAGASQVGTGTNKTPAALDSKTADIKPGDREIEPVVAPPAGGTNSSLTQWAREDGELKRVHFDYDKYSVRSDAAEILKKNRDYLEANPGLQVMIEGHCDERGTAQYNLALGERRANSVRVYLEDLGVDPKRMDIISYGKERPVDEASDETAWAKNRRAEFRVK